MSETSNIEWTDATFNPWIGCTRVSPGCDHCYAATQDKFRHWTPEGWGGPRHRTSVANWSLPKRWNAEAFYQCACGWRGSTTKEWKGTGICCPACEGRLYPARRRVFCASLADVFDNAVDPQWRADLFALIRATPNLDWLLLTKRIGNVLTMLPMDFNPQRYPHVWLGATIVNPAEAYRDIPKLLTVNARVRFLSMEPLLSDADIVPYIHLDVGNTLDWVIVGGESGPGARPMHPDWVRSLRDQCESAGVPFLFKQWGEWTPGENVEQQEGTVAIAKWFNNTWLMSKEDLSSTDGHRDEEPDLYRVGKKAAGRVIDGRTHDGFPGDAA